MPTLTLPQLVAGRDLANAAVHKLGAIDSDRVVVDARPLVSGSASFAAELVRSALVDGHAARITVVGGPAEFLDDLRTAAGSLGVADRLSFTPSDAGLDVAS